MFAVVGNQVIDKIVVSVFTTCCEKDNPGILLDTTPSIDETLVPVNNI